MLVLGAGLGSIVGDLSASGFPEAVSHSQTFAVVGMAALFAAVVRAPLTGIVLMVEMTGARYMTIPLMGVAVIAYECSRLICRTAIYEALADLFLGKVESRA